MIKIILVSLLQKNANTSQVLLKKVSANTTTKILFPFLRETNN